MATFRTAHWFEATRGLRNVGLDVLRISQKDVSKEELAQAFGPKSSKNGWRYDYRLTAEAAREVEELYCRVTSKKKITNNELTLQFARGLLLENRGVEVNWAAFAAHLHSHREKVCYAKAENTGKRQREQGHLTMKILILFRIGVVAQTLTKVSVFLHCVFIITL